LPVETLPGCFGNPASLTSLSSEATLGSAFSVSLSSGTIANGLGALFFGSDGTSAAGCGLVLPGLGELLLSPIPVPKQLAAGPLAAGTLLFTIPVPDNPGLLGLQIALQGAALGMDFTLEASNGLRLTIMP
jgi:hypothetical protein